MEHTIIQDEKINRFEVFESGQIAYLQYGEAEGKMEIIRTFVPPQLEGQGIACELVDAAVNYARRKGLKIKAICSFAEEYLQREGA